VDGKAYAITGNQVYLNQLRSITRRNASRQNADGGFPHLPQGLTDVNYTVWMAEEVLMIRQDDPPNPDADPTLIKAESVLRNRVNPDGSLNYADQFGNYANNPGSYDTRGWTSTLPGIALYLRAMGHDPEAQQVLAFLFSQQGTAAASGAYPDKYDFPEDGLWSNGHPSVLRTSMIFNDLTAMLLNSKNNTCATGASSACTITPNNCAPILSGTGAANSGLTGTDRCINGRQTKCLNADLVQYPRLACGAPTYQCELPGSQCWRECVQYGNKFCINGICSACVEELPNEIYCAEKCSAGSLPDECI
jgi:hypothetical protein